MRLRYVLRRLLRAPLFTVVTAVTLAVGIGANSAIFSVVEGVLLKPLPYRNPDNLVAVNHALPGINFPLANIAPFLYFTYRDEGRTFEDVALWADWTSNVTGLAEPEVVRDLAVTEGFLPLLGIPPALGRWFSAVDTAPGGRQTVILTYGYWETRFGGDRTVLGRNLVVDGTPMEIIGVMPANFRFANSKVALLLPLQLDRNKTFIGNFSYEGIARLKPGLTLKQASADVARMIPIAMRKFPPFPGYTVKMFEDAHAAPRLSLLKDDVVGDIGRTLWF